MQRGFKAIEVASWNIRHLVCKQASQILSYSLPHDSRLAVMHGEAFFVQERRYKNCEPLRASLKIRTARKCQVVGVARVCRSRRLRQSSQPAIRAIETKVGKRWRRGCSLRKVRPGIQAAGFANDNRIHTRSNLVPHIARRGV